jgi:EF-P beta-lysylation protein EpmB
MENRCFALPSWQEAMKRAIRTSRQLLDELELDSALEYRQSTFPVFVPQEYLQRIRKGDAKDPLLLQVLPQEAEDRVVEGFLADPVADHRFEAAPGLIHKYPGRVLLIASGACGIHCRYCFRRHYPYQSAPKSLDQWEAGLRYIEQDTSIVEVILSGGDPWTMVDPLFQSLVQALESIPHVRRLRIHTRMPVVIPQRVTELLCETLKSTRLATWIVLHMNHPREIDSLVEEAIGKLRAAGCSVLNQSVLLRGVNDSNAVLKELSERLLDCHVVPYYVNQLDRVNGASHFEVDVEEGLELIAALRSELPGYGVPRYVQDQVALDPTESPKSKTELFQLESSQPEA